MFSGQQLFLLIMLGVMALGFGDIALRFRRQKRLRRIGKTATALVMEVTSERILRSDATDSDWSDAADRFVNHRKFTYTFLYSIEGEEYIRKFSHERAEQQYSQGETIDIFYNPDNPKEMMTAAETSAPSSIPVSFILLAGAMLAFILYFFFKG